MDKFVIISDTRQQEGKHEAKLAYFKAQGYKVVRTKLFVGDYARLDNQTIAIDTKKDFLELCGNVCGNQHERFRDECKRAKECGIQLIILCEHGKDIKSLEDVIFWKNPRSEKRVQIDGKWQTVHTKAMKGEVLYKILTTLQDKYGVQFVFCDKEDTGSEIVRLLS